ncbi:uncharacterized protein LOC131236216 [Magnolia sinica]|uniref:uncharacterized protein LOC131236216 n=1 Tax=Magnolia sinica TaxID=86752 RepID=UPI00265972B8|nr:uncharacterized protein LOC131236216 [Magnolia sinica]
MYRDIRRQYWWENMKRDIAEYVLKYLTCQQVKAEHHKPLGLLQPLPLIEWKWDCISMDFISGLSKTHGNHDSIWKYELDASHIINWEEIELNDDASYMEAPVRIQDHKEQILHTKNISLVKVLWSRRGVEEATWERQADIEEKYPHLFDNPTQVQF